LFKIKFGKLKLVTVLLSKGSVKFNRKKGLGRIRLNLLHT
jgi:hypothetical protein